jgi:hypothetical protein
MLNPDTIFIIFQWQVAVLTIFFYLINIVRHGLGWGPEVLIVSLNNIPEEVSFICGENRSNLINHQHGRKWYNLSCTPHYTEIEHTTFIARFVLRITDWAGILLTLSGTWVRSRVWHVVVGFVLFILSFTCFHVFRSLLCDVRYDFRVKRCSVRFTPNFVGCSCFINVTCVYLHIMVSNTISIFDDVQQ